MLASSSNVDTLFIRKVYQNNTINSNAIKRTTRIFLTFKGNNVDFFEKHNLPYSDNDVGGGSGIVEKICHTTFPVFCHDSYVVMKKEQHYPLPLICLPTWFLVLVLDV